MVDRYSRAELTLRRHLDRLGASLGFASAADPALSPAAELARLRANQHAILEGGRLAAA